MLNKVSIDTLSQWMKKSDHERWQIAMEYQNDDTEAIRSTLIKDILRSFDAPVPDQKQSNDFMVLGGLVDVLLTVPDVAGDLYYVISEDLMASTVPSDRKVVADLLGNLEWDADLDDDVLVHLLADAFICSPHSRISKESTAQQRAIAVLPYMKHAIKAHRKGSIIISEYHWHQAINVSSCIEHRIHELFTDAQIARQVPIITSLQYEGIEFPARCMIDLVIIDHKQKTITPVDIKTMFRYASVNNIRTTIMNGRYDVQMVYYDMIMQRAWDEPAYKLNPTALLMANFNYGDCYMVKLDAKDYRCAKGLVTLTQQGYVPGIGYALLCLAYKRQGKLDDNHYVRLLLESVHLRKGHINISLWK
ncbi:MAG: hypothetical protein KatS3mg054_0014 [Chloroflexus sp.]|nr:MAG: hypothetical protein KatS3mg054_0014 [Chloroflexus sp.]